MRDYSDLRFCLIPFRLIFFLNGEGTSDTQLLNAFTNSLECSHPPRTFP